MVSPDMRFSRNVPPLGRIRVPPNDRKAGGMEVSSGFGVASGTPESGAVSLLPVFPAARRRGIPFRSALTWGAAGPWPGTRRTGMDFVRPHAESRLSGKVCGLLHGALHTCRMPGRAARSRDRGVS